MVLGTESGVWGRSLGSGGRCQGPTSLQQGAHQVRVVGQRGVVQRRAATEAGTAAESPAELVLPGHQHWGGERGEGVRQGAESETGGRSQRQVCRSFHHRPAPPPPSTLPCIS